MNHSYASLSPIYTSFERLLRSTHHELERTSRYLELKTLTALLDLIPRSRRMARNKERSLEPTVANHQFSL